jgi:Domain of unknown function (DUF4345)
MAKTLKFLIVAMGVACVGIGLMHLVLGIGSVPGEGTATPTVDSRERFYGAIFLGYGIAWLWAARQRPIPAGAVRWLAAIFFLGGIGRVISLVQYGRPQWLQLVLSGIELVLPPVYIALAGADEKASSEIAGAL